MEHESDATVMPESLDRLRATGRIAMALGAIGSLGFFFHASQRTPRFLVVLFVIWVLTPFALLALVDAVSKRWSPFVRAAIYRVMVVVAVGALLAYGVDTWRPPHPQAAFMYVLVAPVACAFVALVVTGAALIDKSRR
jgi:hypothetical protein